MQVKIEIIIQSDFKSRRTVRFIRAQSPFKEATSDLKKKELNQVA